MKSTSNRRRPRNRRQCARHAYNMAILPDSITALIAALSQAARHRAALRRAHRPASRPDRIRRRVKQLAETILHAREKIRFCDICGALTEQSPCAICTDPRRDASLVCVVERAVDILSIEKSGTFRGKFHVLGGKISPLDGVEPEDLRIAELEKRLDARADQGNRHRPGHGRGRRRHQPLSGETAGRSRA